MSDINAPLPYVEPAEDMSDREGGIGLLVLLAVGLAMAAVALAMLSRDEAEPFVLAVLAGLSVVGVFALFAGAVGILRFGERAARNDITKALVDNLPQGALVATSRGKIVYANEAYIRVIGAAEGAGAITVERAFSGNSRVAEQIFRLTRAARRGGAWEEEFCVGDDAAPGGSEAGTRWLRVSVRQIPTRPGKASRAAHTLWLASDITSERNNEDSAFENLQQMIGYLDGAPAGFISAESSGKIAYLNSTMARWLGRDLSEVADGTLQLSDILFGDTGALLAGSGDEPGTPKKRELETDLVRRDGTSFAANILYRPASHVDGAAGLSHMIVFDRPQEENVDGATRAAKARFSRMFHSTPIAIATVDDKGRIGDTNIAFGRMFASAGETFMARETALTDLVAEDDRPALRKALDAARSGQVDTPSVDLVFGEHVERNGRFYFSSAPAIDGEEATVIVHAIDTTDQRALETQFAQSQKMQAVGQLAGGIAHDFNNVLTAIIGFSELLLANHRPTDPAFADIMNIKQNANRAAGLVRQLLAFSRQQRLRPQVLSLNDVLADLTILLGRLLGEKTKLDLQHGRDLWLVKADLHQFEQVVINLAVNARDAMPDGGTLTVRTANVSERESERLGHKGMEPGEYVLCEVSDTGMGMAPEVMAKIFEPFYTTKEVGKGTGLGLSTVYGIVKQTGGYVYPLSGGAGQGTSFHIYLPRHIRSEDEESREAEAELEDARPGKVQTARDLTGSGTILLVEDEEAVRSFAARALEGRGYKVLQAGTGTEALEVMDAHDGSVDLVVSDVVMPEMDGPTLLTKLREKLPDIKIIFISGYAEEAFKNNLEGDENFAFLPKPFSLKQLAAAVKEVLER
ncbi:MAG TPA: PAS domain-containing sensor histidine kinase [Rhizobiales bacterium]|nr:blue-light-activated protein [bacterium BMS3Bbin10]HDO51388.1 PAS domain-containing sensor histidine kinase [Hyphomicrobiales bacterium]